MMFSDLDACLTIQGEKLILFIWTNIPSKLHACAIAHCWHGLRTENLHCGHKKKSNLN